jgi:hypothetical protein
MASELHQFAFTIPAGTTIAVPATQQLTMPPRQVTQLNVKVPPGPRGLMGFAIGASGQAIIPAIPGSWIVTDNHLYEWPLENYIDSGAWEAFGYNLGNFPHTIYLTFYCVVPGIAAGPSVQVIDNTLLDNTVIQSSPFTP